MFIVCLLHFPLRNAAIVFKPLGANDFSNRLEITAFPNDLICSQAARLSRLHFRLDQRGDSSDGWRLKESMNWNVDLKKVPDAGNNASDEQRMAAKIKNIIVHRN